MLKEAKAVIEDPDNHSLAMQPGIVNIGNLEHRDLIERGAVIQGVGSRALLQGDPLHGHRFLGRRTSFESGHQLNPVHKGEVLDLSDLLWRGHCTHCIEPL